MSLFTAEERRLATVLADLIHCNPFLPRRIELERAAMGNEFDERNAHWNADGGKWIGPIASFVPMRRTHALSRASDLIPAMVLNSLSGPISSGISLSTATADHPAPTATTATRFYPNSAA